MTTEPVSETPNINWVYWTLSYEVAFYLWLAIILIIPRSRWIVLFAPALLSIFWHDAPVFFKDQWCLFALGVAIAEWRHQQNPLVFGLVAICLLDAGLHRTNAELVTGLLSMVLIGFSVAKRGEWLNREPILRRVGVWSYSLYLTHVPIAAWVALRVDPWPRAVSVASFPLHFTVDVWALFVSCAFAYFFWQVVEKPAARVAHRKSAFS